MKTSIRLLLAIAVLSISVQNIKAQCAASDILLQNLTPVGTQSSGTCHATFDLSFTMQNNNGNKFIFVHFWKAADYPDYFQCVNGFPSSNGAIHAPDAGDLGNEFLNIGIDNNTATPTVLSSYPPDGSVVLNSVGSITKTILPNGSAFFVLENVDATFPASCGGPLLIKADFWSSQAAQAQVASCVSCGLTYALNFLTVTGLTTCSPLAYNATITNKQSTALTGNYTVYADVNGDGFLSTVVDVVVTATTSFSLAAGVGSTTPISGSIPSANINQDLIVVTNLSIGGTDVFLIPATICSPLPVVWLNFNATRVSRTGVNLTWTTASEVNNYGFAILRNMGGNNWETVGFIPSQATGGNSGTPLTYSFSDVNSYAGMSQYRIRQVDLDGKFKYTDIRSVRGYGQKGKIIVYPNPSAGNLNVVFEDAKMTRDVTLIDMGGRAVKQWKAVTGNTLQITGLEEGMYSLRIVAREINEVTTEKIIVVKSKLQ
jgi:type IX secretion system substrate protein